MFRDWTFTSRMLTILHLFQMLLWLWLKSQFLNVYVIHNEAYGFQHKKDKNYKQINKNKLPNCVKACMAPSWLLKQIFHCPCHQFYVRVIKGSKSAPFLFHKEKASQSGWCGGPDLTLLECLLDILYSMACCLTKERVYTLLGSRIGARSIL